MPMPEKRRLQTRKEGFPSRTSDPLASLRKLPVVEILSYYGLKTVVATRVMALCNQTGREPLLELTQRFACVTTAKSFVEFADIVGRYWPQDIHVMRPCCRIISPDELAMAHVVDAAAIGDREALSRELHGLMRPERQAQLFDQATALVAVMQ